MHIVRRIFIEAACQQDLIISFLLFSFSIELFSLGFISSLSFSSSSLLDFIVAATATLITFSQLDNLITENKDFIWSDKATLIDS